MTKTLLWSSTDGANIQLPPAVTIVTLSDSQVQAAAADPSTVREVRDQPSVNRYNGLPVSPSVVLYTGFLSVLLVGDSMIYWNARLSQWKKLTRTA